MREKGEERERGGGAQEEARNSGQKGSWTRLRLPLAESPGLLLLLVFPLSCLSCELLSCPLSPLVGQLASKVEQAKKGQEEAEKGATGKGEEKKRKRRKESERERRKRVKCWARVLYLCGWGEIT